MTDDQMIRSRRIAAPPAAIFALLRDPSRHHETEPTDWVRSAIDDEPITAVGQVFGMNMYATGAGGDYIMHNEVTAFEEGTTIGWRPGQYSDEGKLGFGGWSWRYDLRPDQGGTEVTLTYDWSAAPDRFRELFSLPPFGPDFLDDSLAALDRAVLADQDQRLAG